MPAARRKPLPWRIAASFLAVSGLLGHGSAMLLVAWLAPAPAAAGPAVGGETFYGEICSAASESAALAAEDRGDGEPGPRHPAGGVDACPVCTAFAHSGQAALPPMVTLPLRRAATSGEWPVQDAGVVTVQRIAAPPRAPPLG
jgi:hypothetical protein